MNATATQLSAEQLVKQKHPTAFVDDDGERVAILIKKTVTERCPHCDQDWTHQVTNLMVGSIGRGGTDEYAWQNAAKNLGLM